MVWKIQYDILSKRQKGSQSKGDVERSAKKDETKRKNISEKKEKKLVSSSIIYADPGNEGLLNKHKTGEQLLGQGTYIKYL